MVANISSVADFLFSYFMIFLVPILFIIWKVVKKTKWKKPEEVNLYEDLEEIEEYQRDFEAVPPK